MISEGTADVAAIADRLAAAGANAQQAMTQALMDSATYLAETMRSLCPVDTGNLRDSIGIQVVGDRVIVGPDMSQAPYAGYVEFGTKPHEIRPKEAKALRFQMGNKTVYARVVHHPGTQPAYFVARAFQQWQDSLGPLAAQTGAQLITGGAS